MSRPFGRLGYLLIGYAVACAVVVLTIYIGSVAGIICAALSGLSQIHYAIRDDRIVRAQGIERRQS